MPSSETKQTWPSGPTGELANALHRELHRLRNILGFVGFGGDIFQKLQLFMLFVKGVFGLFQLGNVETYAVNEPGPAIPLPNHFGFALKPNHPAIPRDHAVTGFQGIAGKKHLRGIGTPSRFILGMYVLIPAHGILQPFALRKPERRLDLRTDVGVTDAFIDGSHEDHGGDLLDQRAISRFVIQPDVCFILIGGMSLRSHSFVLKKNGGHVVRE